MPNVRTPHAAIRLSSPPLSPPPYQPPTLPGCYADSSRRLLTNYSIVSPVMTKFRCASICFSRGLPYAGVEVRNECFCGNSFAYTPIPVPGACNKACIGNPNETCGGDYALYIYESRVSPLHHHHHARAVVAHATSPPHPTHCRG